MPRSIMCWNICIPKLYHAPMSWAQMTANGFFLIALLILLCYYELIIDHIRVTMPRTLNFETSSDASEFIDLENLIGSFHTYAPKYARLMVRDMNLTNGQRKLLCRYENIEVVSAAYIQSTDVRKIDVHHEFIFDSNGLYSRNNKGKHIHIDLIRKQFYLAIVIPFTKSQLSRLLNQLNTHELYQPCRTRSDLIDLILYYNTKTPSSLKKHINQLSYLNRCYKSIRYFAADLPEKEDRHPIGSARMWQKLFINEQSNYLSLRAHGYTHFFLMEPDVRPIRSYWLDAIVEHITEGHNEELYIATQWWMVGSIYRGSLLIGNGFLHINGNALYHLSLSFIRFIENVSDEYPYDSEKSNGYDLNLFLYLFQHIDTAKRVWHKFQFTDLIQNCWKSSCKNMNIDFIFNNPSTYLIHGHNITLRTNK